MAFLVVVFFTALVLMVFDGDAVDGLVTLFLVTLAAVGEALGEVAAAVAADLDLVLAIL